MIFTGQDVEAIRQSELFDGEWYLANNADVRALGMDPAEHYLWLGARLGRQPSERFDGNAYAARHPGAALDGVNPLLHYIRQREKARSQGRRERPAPAESLAAAPRLSLNRTLDLLQFARLTREELRQNAAFAADRQPLTDPPATAAWFIPDAPHVLKGGVRTIFTTAQHFSRRWGTANRFVVVVRPGEEVDVEGMEASLRRHFADLKATVEVHRLGEPVADMPPADIGICSLWTTAYVLAKFNQTKKKFYFVQDFEPIFYPAGAVYGAIEATYRFGFSCIANTEGVASRYREYSDDVMSFVPGVDRAVFREDPEKRAPSRPAKVMFYGRPVNDRNGFGLGMTTLLRLKERMGSDVDIVSAGADWDEEDYGLAGVVRNLGLLGSLDEVAALYRQSDLGLVFMFTPHPSYQPLEYMASGCVAVTNRNAANGWLLRDGENCLAVEPIPEVIAREMCDLLTKDDGRWARLREGGLQTVDALTWDRALSDIEAFVLD